jgi:hypothetical protein
MMKTDNHELPRELTSEELDIVAGGQGPGFDVLLAEGNKVLIEAEKAGLIRIEKDVGMVQKDLGMVIVG